MQLKKSTANAVPKDSVVFEKNTLRKSCPKFTLPGAGFDFKNGNFVQLLWQNQQASISMNL